LRVAVHEAIEKADDCAFRCTLSGLEVDRWLEAPAWDAVRMACSYQRHLATSLFVSMRTLMASPHLVGSASKNLSQSPIDIGDTGTEKAPPNRRSSADPSVRRTAAGLADANVCVAGVAEGDQEYLADGDL
jgi:hypothetical protein